MQKLEEVLQKQDKAHKATSEWSFALRLPSCTGCVSGLVTVLEAQILECSPLLSMFELKKRRRCLFNPSSLALKLQ